MSDELTTLELGNYTQMSYRIHPSVPLQMMELYYRRSSEFIVGTLLGHIDYTHVDITNCYAVPFVDTKQQEDTIDEPNLPKKPELVVDRDYNRKMFDLTQKIYPNEVVVGFFCNFPEMNYDLLPIYGFYSTKESMFRGKMHVFNFPLALLFDPLAKDTTFGLRAYTNQQLYFGKDLFGLFQQVNLTYEFFNQTKNEVSPLWLDIDTKEGEKQNQFGLVNLDSLEEQIQETLKNIKKMEEYVKAVNEGKETGDEEIGKQIKKLIGMGPSIDEGQFRKILDTYKQDIVMLMYLNNLASSENLISEKLGKVF